MFDILRLSDGKLAEALTGFSSQDEELKLTVRLMPLLVFDAWDDMNSWKPSASTFGLLQRIPAGTYDLYVSGKPSARNDETCIFGQGQGRKLS